MKIKFLFSFILILFISCNKDVTVGSSPIGENINSSSNTGSSSGSSNTGSTSGSSNTGSTSGSSNTGSTSGSSSLNINNNLYTIHKISDKIYVGGDGVLLYSDNNGITFNLVIETDLRIFNIYFENENQGVLAGTNGGNSSGYKTSNGGVTWERIFQSGYDPDGSEFTSGIYSSNEQEKIIILRNNGSYFGSIYFSENAGIDWDGGGLGSLSNSARNTASSKSFLLNGNLYISGGGYLGGSNGTSFFYSSFFQDNSTDLIDIRLGLRMDVSDLFFTSNYGYLVGTNTNGEGGYGISSDNGNNWTFKTIPGYGDGVYIDLTSVYFITDEIGFISTSNGDLLKTTNLGLTWTLVHEGDGTRINDIEQISSNQLLMVGMEGMIEIFEF
jgi:photosystem II stability/assembly factor-like uncharacterized protein